MSDGLEDGPDRDLTPEARAMLSADKEARRDHPWQEHFVEHHIWFEVTQALERILRATRKGQRHLLLVGMSGMGKTAIGEELERRRQAEDNADADVVIVPVLFVEVPAPVTPKILACAVLDKLGADYNERHSEDALVRQAVRLMRACGVEVLILDEFQHVFRRARGTRRQETIDNVKLWGGRNGPVILAIGVEEARLAILADKQTARRFSIIRLDKWTLDENWIAFLNQLERVMPLRRESRLYEERTARWLLVHCEGNTSDLIELLELAYDKAIEKGEERITYDLLRSLKWVLPSVRRPALPTIAPGPANSRTGAPPPQPSA